MTAEQWVEAAGAAGGLLAGVAAIVVAVIAGRIARRQARDTELQRARLDYYKEVIRPMNQIMCYVTFIGKWKEFSPPQIIRLKRELDESMHCAIPLFSDSVHTAYNNFMESCFDTFGAWGTDASIRSSTRRRRDAMELRSQRWDPSWEDLFSDRQSDTGTKESLEEVRDVYNACVVAMVTDLDLNRARESYVTDLVSLNANSPTRSNI